jgi:hypothetical protein
VRLVYWLRRRFHVEIENVIGHNESLSSPYHPGTSCRSGPRPTAISTTPTCRSTGAGSVPLAAARRRIDRAGRTPARVPLLDPLWAEIDPSVEPVSFAGRPNGGVAVDVQQVVRTHDGALVNESVVVHVYSFRGGLIAHTEIEEPGSGRLE